MKTLLTAVSVVALTCGPALAQSTNFYSFADTDADGFISSEELAAVSPVFDETYYTQFDLDGSGDLVAEEIATSPILRGFTFSTPAQFRRDAPVIVRRYGTFQQIDANGDGILSAGEISAALPSVTRDRYVSADLNRDGVLDFNELYGWRYYTRLDDVGGVLISREGTDRGTLMASRDGYARIDRNRDGVISMQELSRVAPGATLEQFAMIDANDDGVIVYHELYDSGLVGEEVAPGVFEIGQTRSASATTTTTTTRSDGPSYAIDSYSFALLDADDDRMMTLDELRAAIPTITAADLGAVDANADGFIRYSEYSTSPVIVRYYEGGAFAWPAERTVSVRRSYFTGMDTNRDGMIDADELMAASPAATRTVYTSVDTDEDGVVSYSELYGADWFNQAVEQDAILTPSYVYRYSAPRR